MKSQRLWTAEQVGEHLGINVRLVQRYVNQGRLVPVEHVQAGRGRPSPRFDPADVRAFAKKPRKRGNPNLKK